MLINAANKADIVYDTVSIGGQTELKMMECNDEEDNVHLHWQVQMKETPKLLGLAPVYM